MTSGSTCSHVRLQMLLLSCQGVHIIGGVREEERTVSMRAVGEWHYSHRLVDSPSRQPKGVGSTKVSPAIWFERDRAQWCGHPSAGGNWTILAQCLIDTTTLSQRNHTQGLWIRYSLPHFHIVEQILPIWHVFALTSDLHIRKIACQGLYTRGHKNLFRNTICQGKRARVQPAWSIIQNLQRGIWSCLFIHYKNKQAWLTHPWNPAQLPCTTRLLFPGVALVPALNIYPGYSLGRPVNI